MRCLAAFVFETVERDGDAAAAAADYDVACLGTAKGNDSEP